MIQPYKSDVYPKYKPGDRVKCVSVPSCGYFSNGRLIEGRVYTVLQVSKLGWHLKLADIAPLWIWHKHFRKIGDGRV